MELAILARYEDLALVMSSYPASYARAGVPLVDELDLFIADVESFQRRASTDESGPRARAGGGSGRGPSALAFYERVARELLEHAPELVEVGRAWRREA